MEKKFFFCMFYSCLRISYTVSCNLIAIILWLSINEIQSKILYKEYGMYSIHRLITGSLEKFVRFRCVGKYWCMLFLLYYYKRSEILIFPEVLFQIFNNMVRIAFLLIYRKTQNISITFLPVKNNFSESSSWYACLNKFFNLLLNVYKSYRSCTGLQIEVLFYHSWKFLKENL